MCGITGWFSSKATTSEDKSILQGMMASIKHRGPDGEGRGIFGDARFGHVRLAIIDPIHGKQPMTTVSGLTSIIFNGEIYNYKSLKKELTYEGHKFKTDSDSEVIAVLYERYGVKGFSKLRGMYAFSLWDHNRESGYLVRDPIGIKPLFYWLSLSNNLYFGSEAKAILSANTELSVLDESSLHLLMNFRYLPGDRSLFKGIRQLKPGEIIKWTRHEPIESQMHQTATEIESGNVQSALEDSVRAHLVSDVPIGAYLSGGLDSALVCALAKSCLEPNSLKTYTVDAGDDPNEAINAARTADILGIANHCDKLKSVPSQNMERLIWHLEVPKVNAFQIDRLANSASKNRKVVLSGLGGDELFLGYNAHQILFMCDLAAKLPKSVRRPVEGMLHFLKSSGDKDIWSERDRAVDMFRSLGNQSRVYGLLRNVWDSPELRQQIYGPRMLDAYLVDSYEELEKLWPKQRSFVDASREFEWGQKMVNDLLWQEDRCSMANGLEVRVPFVDAKLKRYVDSLNRKEIMPFGRKKYLLKKVAGNILPHEIISRPKSGFQVDSPSFFHSNLNILAEEYLSPSVVRDIGLFNPDFVRNARNLPINKKYRWHYFMLYLMLGTHIWIKQFETS
jgi:asparagine synthase (glutamine-hydrolysing)